jgi:hypothetical protein
VVDREDAADAPEGRAFEIEAHRLALNVIGVAERQRFERVDALTGAALESLYARRDSLYGRTDIS